MRTQATSHTPTPWRTHSYELKAEEKIIPLTNIISGHRMIAIIDSTYNSVEESNANAAYICRCVNEYESLQRFRNAHEGLLDSLRFVRQTVHQAHHEGPIEGCAKNTCDAISQAIAAAEELDKESGKR